jgi:DNA-binding transcriptional ArsR family regulator
MKQSKRARDASSLPVAAGRPLARDRAPMTVDMAAEMARLFKVLASETRLRLLHALTRDHELSVTQLSERVEMSPQAVSNQLQRLFDRGVVASRREGTQIHYRLADPCVPSLLDLGFCLIEETRRGASGI